MDAQRDYETEPTIAVFDSQGAAHRAAEELRARHFDVAAIAEEPLAAGRYQAEDPSLWEVTAGMVRGALWGAPVGLLLGFGQVLLLEGFNGQVALALHGSTLLLEVVAGGALGGALLGAFIGAVQRTRFDDDEAEWIEVPGAGAREVLAVYTSGPSPRVRQVLRRTGALGFLDPTIPDTELALHSALPA